MKKIAGIWMAGMLAANAWAAAEPNEAWTKPRIDLFGQGTLVLPTGDNDADWVDAYELKGTFWFTPMLGAGLSCGVGSWSLEDETVRPPYALAELEDEESDLTIGTLPLGASLYLRPWTQGRFALNLEAGVRYLAVWDDVSIEWTGESAASDDEVTILVEHDADVDDAWVALLGADLEVNVSSAFYVSLGVGYQFDLGSSEYRLWNEPPRKLSFEGAALRAGLGLRF